MTINIPEIRGAYYGARPREVRFVDLAAPADALEWDIREDGKTSSFRVAGYASTTGQPYEVNDWLGSYNETIARGAFAKTLQERADVRFLINHDGVPLARTASGTMSLREIMNAADDPQQRGQTGLWMEADLDARSPLAQTLRSALERGDMSQMSFAFAAVRQTWNEDYTEREVNEVRLYDTSAVTYPANPTTSISLDSANLAALMGRIDSGKIALDADDRATILDLIERAGVMPEAEPTIDAVREDMAADAEEMAEADEKRANRLRFLKASPIRL